MRRRRRSTGIWLPNIGTKGADDDSYPASSVKHVSFLLGGAEPGPLTGIVPILWDVPFEASEFTPNVDNLSLGEFIKNAYFLKRICGNVFVSYEPQNVVGPPSNLGPPAVQVTIGFFVARATDADEQGGFNTPIGGATAVGANEDYNPENVNCIREPWIWRRTWLLGNPFFANFIEESVAGGSFATNQDQPLGAARYPPNNSGYGSMGESTKIDAKTKRRVTSDDRLWAATAIRSYPYKFDDYVADQLVNIAFDVRCFGQPIKDRNRGTF